METSQPNSIMTLDINSKDESYVDCTINLVLPQITEDFSSFNIILPFKTDEIQPPLDIICLSENVANKYSLINILVPSNYEDIVISLRSNSLITPSSDGNDRTIKINFIIDDEIPEILWLKQQNTTIYTFDEIKINFPYTINVESVFDKPNHIFEDGQSRYYTFKAIVENNDGILEINFPNSENFYLILASFVEALGVEFVVAVATFYNSDREKTKEKITTLKVTSIVSWVTTLGVAYIWVISGSWPVNIILPILVIPLVIAITVSARIIHVLYF